MDASSIRNKPRQSGDATIVVIPSAPQYVYQMERCHQLAYGYEAGKGNIEDLTAEQYAQHIRIFPEGQFIALDTLTDTVVGVATSMRLNLPQNHDLIGTWVQTTGGG
jgi:hypothetical protein